MPDSSTYVKEVESEIYKNYYLSRKINLAIIGIGMLTGSTSIPDVSDTSAKKADKSSMKLHSLLPTSDLQSLNTSSTDDIFDLNEYQLKKIDISDKIESFSQLDENWNGYGASSIADEVVEKSIQLLFDLQGLPQVFPTGRDSIQFEYENFDTGDYLEIEIFDSKTVAFSIIDGIEEENIDISPTELNKYISRVNVA